MPSSGPRSQCAFGSKSNGARLAHAPHLHVVVGAAAHRHGLVRHVGNARQHLAELLFQRFGLLVERGYLRAQLAHLLLPRGGIGALAAQPGDFGDLRVAARLKLLGFGDGGAPALVQFAKTLQAGNCAAARGEPLDNLVEMRAEKGEIVHPPC